MSHDTHTQTDRDAPTAPTTSRPSDWIQAAYDRVIRPHLPRRLSVLNGVTTRRAKLLDTTDVHPEYEAAIVDALRQHVHEGDEVLVIGGGYGVSTVVAAEEAGAIGQVTCFEASSEHAEIVEETTRLNGVDDRTDVRHAVVGEAVETYGPLAGAREIHPRHLPGCDVLELDCEGAEFAILGQMEFRPRVVIVESHGHLGTPSEKLYRQLETLGYRVADVAAEDPENDVWVLTAVYRSVTDG